MACGFRSSADESRAKLTVADTGQGIAREHLGHVFERFCRAKPARSSVGTGLGLSICHWIVTAHGGEISVESALGWGEAFTVTLPLAREQADGFRTRSRAPVISQRWTDSSSLTAVRRSESGIRSSLPFPDRRAVAIPYPRTHNKVELQKLALAAFRPLSLAGGAGKKSANHVV